MAGGPETGRTSCTSRSWIQASESFQRIFRRFSKGSGEERIPWPKNPRAPGWASPSARRLSRLIGATSGPRASMAMGAPSTSACLPVRLGMPLRLTYLVHSCCPSRRTSADGMEGIGSAARRRRRRRDCGPSAGTCQASSSFTFAAPSDTTLWAWICPEPSRKRSPDRPWLCLTWRPSPSISAG